MTRDDVRQRLVSALEADLVGPFTAEHLPGGGQEVLPLPPSRWYLTTSHLTGFLAPRHSPAPLAREGLEAPRTRRSPASAPNERIERVSLDFTSDPGGASIFMIGEIEVWI